MINVLCRKKIYILSSYFDPMVCEWLHTGLAVILFKVVLRYIVAWLRLYSNRATDNV